MFLRFVFTSLFFMFCNILGLAQSMQYVVIYVYPQNSIVLIDGEEVPVNDGIAKKLVTVAKHEYEVSSDGYYESKGLFTFNNAQKQEKLTITLKQKYGWLSLRTNAKCGQSKVFIDEKLIGDAPIARYPLNSGIHDLRIENEFYKHQYEQFHVEDSIMIDLFVNLSENFMPVSIKCEDKNADIVLNGNILGKGSYYGEFVAGVYEIESRKNGCTSEYQTLVLTNDSVNDILLKAPIPSFGNLNVTPVVNGTLVYVDKKEYGEGPVFIESLPIGSHEIIVSKDGYLPWKENFVIKKDSTLDIVPHLIQKEKRSFIRCFEDNNANSYFKKYFAYLMPSFQIENHPSLGMAFGGNIYNFNLELSVMSVLNRNYNYNFWGLKKQSSTSEEWEKIKNIKCHNIEFRTGYSIHAHKKVLVTPQYAFGIHRVGTHAVLNRENWARQLQHILGLRLDVAIKKWLAIGITPQYSWKIKQDEHYASLDKSSEYVAYKSDFELSNGFNIRLGLIFKTYGF